MSAPLVEIGFEPRFFEASAIAEIKEDIQQKLRPYDFGYLRVVLKRKIGLGFALDFYGPSEHVRKAKNILRY